MVILATKPYQIADIIKDNKVSLTNKIVISIAAGIYYDDLDAMLLEGTHHISTIPNTPIVTDKGILITEAKHSLSNEGYDLFLTLFSKITLIEVIDRKTF